MRAASIRNAARMHGKVPGNPARGEAQGRIDVRPRWSHVGPQSGVEAQKSKPFLSARSLERDHPDENQSGVDGRARTTRGPGRTEMSLTRLAAALVRRDHPEAGSNLRRVKNPRSAAGRARGKDLSSGRAA
jgi:hypothetical protein